MTDYLRYYLREIFYSIFLMIPGHRSKNVNVILAYHAVGKETDGAIRQNQFERQMKYLSDSYSVICLSDLTRDHLMSEQPTAVLTFDDGHRSHSEIVGPLLETLGIKATFFVCPGLLNDQRSTKDQGNEYMSSSQVKNLHASGHEIGAHGMNHVSLQELSRKEARREVEESRDFLEELTGSRVDSFAYPYGHASDQVEDIVREAGFSRAVTTRETLLTSTDSSCFRLPRMLISNQLSYKGFKLRVSDKYPLIRRLK
ncbi:MAG: polysaccharide deacetylase family protein [bacterium]